MIVVTGSKRSGTSMWMQILVAAGLPYIGDKFPRDWGELFRGQNPDGYYESELMAGIYWETNPHPRTGEYLFPQQTRDHAVKVFAPGLLRTDVAFLDRVIATVRGVRAQCQSLSRFQEAMTAARGRNQAPALSPGLSWWAETFGLVRDIATRGYPAHVVTYESVLQDPRAKISEVLAWIGHGDLERAISTVDEAGPAGPDHAAPDPFDLEPAALQVCDELHRRLHVGEPLDDAFIESMNDVQQELAPRLLEHEAKLQQAAAKALQ